MTHPPHDDERDAGTSGPRPDPDQNLTQPVQPYDRPAPPAAASYGQPGPGQSQSYGHPGAGQQPHGQSAGNRPPGYGPPPQQYGQPIQQPTGQPAQQPWSPSYGQPGYGQAPAQYGQPQYGPPGYPTQYGPPGQPYGQPYPVQPQKSKVGLIAGLTGLVLLLIAGVVAALVAMQSTVLDPAAVERDVAAQFEQREGVAIDLTCAEEMQVDEGDSYRCTGVTADGEEVTLQITITDEETAAYTWTEP